MYDDGTGSESQRGDVRRPESGRKDDRSQREEQRRRNEGRGKGPESQSDTRRLEEGGSKVWTRRTGGTVFGGSEDTEEKREQRTLRWVQD